MVLHRSNFEIPARFSFRPFNARWEICTAELVDWCEKPKPLTGGMVKPITDQRTERESVEVRIEVQDYFSTSGMLTALGLRPHLAHTVEMDRDDIPHDLLAAHENRQTSPDISGRSFPVLVCSQPEFKTLFPFTLLKPGDSPKNAWVMRDEFLNHLGDSDDFEWLSGLRKFLNRWGLWKPEYGFHVRWLSMGTEPPGFVLAFPHLLREKRDEYRKALDRKRARKWLSTARPLSFTTIDEPPYFLVERFYCEEAIQATITIDHLAGRRFGFCKRCGEQFEQETEHKKSYCSRRCIQAAGVKRWREKQRKPEWTAAKIAKLLSQKGAKRNAKS